MQTPIMIAVSNLEEAAVALNAVNTFRQEGLMPKEKPALKLVTDALSPLAERIYAALNTSTFTKPSQVATRVLLASSPSEQVPLSRLIDAFIAAGLAKNYNDAWNRLRATFANLSWLMRERLSADDLAGASRPIDVFAIRSLDQSGKRLYRLSEAGRTAAKKFFNGAS